MVDWASKMEERLRTRYAGAEKVILIGDNLNTHTMNAFYKAFSAEQARAIVHCSETRFSPKHGSWLNIAQNELRSMTRQSLHGRRHGGIQPGPESRPRGDADNHTSSDC